MAPPVCHIKLQQQHVRPRAAQPRLSSNHSALQAISPHTANYKKDRNNVQPDFDFKNIFSSNPTLFFLYWSHTTMSCHLMRQENTIITKR